MARKTMPESPLDMLTEPASKATKASRRGLVPAGTKSETAKPQSTKVEKERLTVHVSVEVIERVKNAVFWTPGLTMAAMAEESLTGAVDRLEKKRGEAFPPRTHELKGGRPMK